MKPFDVNDGFLYGLVAVVIAFVIIESAVFLLKAWRRAKALNMDMAKLKRIVTASAVFTVAPAIAILLGVITLSKALGFPLPWLRLSVVGALTYELPAAQSAVSAFGKTLSERITDPAVFSAIAWVMTIGIVLGLVVVLFFGKKIEGGLMKIKSKDEKWGQIFMDGLFLGMISAFLGVVFAKIGSGLVGWIPVFVMLISAVLMALCGLLRNIFHWRFIEDYAMPISMLGAMALSIPLTNFISSVA